MEMELGEPPEDIASLSCKGFVMRLVGFGIRSLEVTPTHGNYLPLWDVGEEQEGHQIIVLALEEPQILKCNVLSAGREKQQKANLPSRKILNPMGLKEPAASQAHEATTKENTKAPSGLTSSQRKRDGQSQEGRDDREREEITTWANTSIYFKEKQKTHISSSFAAGKEHKSPMKLSGHSTSSDGHELPSNLVTLAITDGNTSTEGGGGPFSRCCVALPSDFVPELQEVRPVYLEEFGREVGGEAVTYGLSDIKSL
ncbi:hypothetical protein WISP_55153 [Willisornis vidua]|uniref:Uncharacterized protein n=1 Tax=Willisornis vidua TaxID=1566151 RepID=A0ABQ9DCF3_9PASS|nr:hypothetical protein WISP_55153 [Willisornis vidua]